MLATKSCSTAYKSPSSTANSIASCSMQLFGLFIVVWVPMIGAKIGRRLAAGVAAAMLIAGLGLLAPANATLLINIERVSDTHAVVTGSGTLDAPSTNANPHVIVLEDPFSLPPLVSQNVGILSSTSLTFDGKSIEFAWDLGENFNWTGNSLPAFYFGSIAGAYSTGAAFNTGQMDLVLAAGSSWAPVGSSGDIYWGSLPGVVVGRWVIGPSGSGQELPANSAMLLLLPGLVMMFLYFPRKTGRRSSLRQRPLIQTISFSVLPTITEPQNL